MTPEEKELLVRVLCAMLPYGLVINIGEGDLKLDRHHQGIGILYPEDCSDEFNERNNNSAFYITISGCYYGEDIKPYLRPMSSMTKDEKQESRWYQHDAKSDNFILYMNRYEEWLDSKHFDWRTDGDGKTMIELGLALEAPTGMYNN